MSIRLAIFLLISCPPATQEKDTWPWDTSETGGCIVDDTAETDPPDTSVDTALDTAHTGDTAETQDTGGPCPPDMALVDGDFCVDIWEASRPNATATSSGSDESQAHSAPGVLPWKVADNATASAACVAAGKRLCSEDEWYTACVGPTDTTYGYGDTYDADACAGGDAFCTCTDGSHYQGCYYACGGDPELQPTGTWPACTNGWGLFDVNGNLWEHIQGGTDSTVRGGAYNCGDAATFHRCDYVPSTWSPSARGFRCCADHR